MIFQNFKHIIWDWNGTLLDDAWVCVEIMAGMMEKRGLAPLTFERYQGIFRFPVKGYYQDLGFNFSEEPFENVSTEFITAYYANHPRVALQKDVVRVLTEAARRGISQSVLSASKHSYLTQAIADFNLTQYFTTLKGIANHHAAGKSAIGKAFIESQNISAKDILLVGDTTHDVEVAHEIGAHCVLVESGHQNRVRLEATGVPVYDTLIRLLD